MIKDGGTNPSTTCKIAAQQLAADSDIVGVVGAMRSSCSKASHQYFRDNGKKIMDTNVIERDLWSESVCCSYHCLYLVISLFSVLLACM